MGNIITCDICDKAFSKRDDYVSGELRLKYTTYLGDDGSDRVGKDYDLCEDCAYKIMKVIDDLKKEIFLEKRKKQGNDT